MGILPDQFSDDEIGLEAPPAQGVENPETVDVAVVNVFVCPNCGSDQAQVQQSADASVAVCPSCQCEFGAEPNPVQTEPVEPEPALESAVERILGKVFERHVRHQTHMLKRAVGHARQEQYHPKLPSE